MRSKLLFLLYFLTGTAVFAQTHRNELGFQTDNDSYLARGSDRYYTNGFFFYFHHALAIKNRDSTSLQNKVLGFEFGQKIFNAQAGQIPARVFVDRPFAGYLYVASTLNLLFKNESNIKLSAQLGVVGPASGAEAIQVFIHQTFGLYKIQGWQFQIKDDAELNLGMEYNKLLTRGSAVDLSLSSYANLGNGFTGAGAGPLLRIGNFNQLFNSQSTRSEVIAKSTLAPLHPYEFFFYYKPLLNLVAYDATIQGSLFSTHNYFVNGEVTQTPQPVVFSQQLGVVYSTKRWTYDVSVIFHTKDTPVMIRQSHQWGAIQAFYLFN